MQKRTNQVFIAGLLIAFAIGCGDNTNGVPQDPSALHASLQTQLQNRVAAVSYPLQYLTQRITGTDLPVDFTVGHRPSDQNWQPSETDVAGLQKADLVIANGPGAIYADWLSRVSLSDSKVCNSCTNLSTKDFIMVEDHKIVHQHGPEGEHSHPYLVAYSWLDPAIAKKQAKRILSALSSTYPDKKESFEANFNALVKDLDQLSTELASLDSGAVTDSKVLAINPLTKFFTRAAKVNEQHLLWFDDQDDGKRKPQLEQMLKELRGDDATNSVILIYPKDGIYGLDKTLGDNFIEDFGLIDCPIETLDRTPESGDYLSVMRENIDALKNALGDAKP